MLTMSCASISRLVEQITDEIKRGQRPPRIAERSTDPTPGGFHLKYPAPDPKYACLVP
jgi:hypothetical protein